MSNKAKISNNFNVKFVCKKTEASSQNGESDKNIDKNKKTYNNIIIYDNSNFDSYFPNRNTETTMAFYNSKEYNSDNPTKTLTQCEKNNSTTQNSSSNANTNTDKEFPINNEVYNQKEDNLELLNNQKSINDEDYLKNMNPINKNKKNFQKVENNINCLKIAEPKFIAENDNNIFKDDIDVVMFLALLCTKLFMEKGRFPRILIELGAEGEHNNLTIDNAIKSILNSFKESVDNFVHNKCINDGINLQKLNAKIGSNKKEYKVFFRAKLEEKYNASIPKLISKDMREERKKGGFRYQHNIALIKNIKLRENLNKDTKQKIYNTLFTEVSFLDMLKAFFDTKIKIIKKGSNTIELDDNFKRYDPFYKAKYGKKADKYKKIIMNMIDSIEK